MTPSRSRSIVIQPKSLDHPGTAHFFKARFSTFEIPLVRDAIVIGRESPASLETLLATLKMVSTEVLVGIPIDNEVVGAIIIRDSLLRKLPAGLIEKFVEQRVKPYMSAFEILRLDIELEIILEANV